MRQQQHTQELWEYYRIDPRTASDGFFEPYSPWVAGAGPRLVNVGRSLFIHADDMRRIVACVNACVGLDTEALEKFGLAALGRELADIRKQRDELLAALEKAAAAFWKLDDADVHAQEAESAIASVKDGV